MADALNRYGRRRTMRDHMQEDVPAVIVQKCLDAAEGTPLSDIGVILMHKCVNRGLDPGTSSGPKGWGWFPTIIATEVRLRREQRAALQDPTRKKHWSEYNAATSPEMLRGISAFSTVDDLEAIA
jgi:hypothetical protein